VKTSSVKYSWGRRRNFWQLNFYEKNNFIEIKEEELPDEFPVMEVDKKFYCYYLNQLTDRQSQRYPDITVVRTGGMYAHDLLFFRHRNHSCGLALAERTNASKANCSGRTILLGRDRRLCLPCLYEQSAKAC
jgi:hypothetical protein